MKKTRTYIAKGMEPEKAQGKVRTTKCAGLRPRRDADGLEATPALAEAAGARGLKPLCEYRTEAGETGLLLTKGVSLYRLCGEPGAMMAPEALAGVTLPGAAVCAAGGTGEATVMCEGESFEAVRIVLEGAEARLAGEPANYPAAELRAVPAGSYSASCGPRKTDYAPLTPSTLKRETAAALEADLTDAYLRCVEGSLAAGAYIQPALVAYRYLDRRGRVLYESRPVLLGRDNRCESYPTGFVDRAVTSEGEASAFTLMTDGWRAELSLPAGFAQAAPDVAAVELLAGEQFHPYHPEGKAEAIGVSRGNFRGVSVALPGHYLGLSATSETAVGRHRMAAACGAFGEMAHVAGRLTPDASGARQELTGRFGTGDLSAAGSVRRLEKAVETARKAGRGPGRLWARTCGRDAGRIVWGNMRWLRPAGIAPGSLVTVRAVGAATSWRGSVSVGFGRGPERVVAEWSGTGAAPTHLSPVLSYGDPAAREMRVQISSGGRVYDRRFALEPDPTGRTACYIEPGFAPIDVREGVAGLFEAESGCVTGDAEPTGLASADAGEPLRVLARGRCTGAVESLVAAATGNQAWEYGRHRFAAATTAGLSAITTGSGTMSVRDVWQGRVDALAAAGSEGVFALSEGRLLRMGPTGSVKMVATPSPGTLLSYVDGLRLLTGGAWTLDMASGAFYTDAEHKAATGAGRCGGLSYLLRGEEGRLMLPGTETAAGHADVDFEVTVDTEACGHRPRALRLDMAGAQATVSVYVTEEATAGSMTETPVGLWSVRGRVGGPLRLRLSPRRTTQGRLRVHLQGRVSGDFVIRNICLDYDC